MRRIASRNWVMTSGKLCSLAFPVLSSCWHSPDYDKLRILRKLYPRVPIMALSATCGPQVLQDLIRILGLNAIVDGKGQ